MPAPSVLLVADMADPADHFDRAFLEHSDDHVFVGAVSTEEALKAALQNAESGIDLVVTSCYGAVAALIAEDRALIRERVARIFVVGGQVNTYTVGASVERVPFDPRLRERNPERFSPSGDPRVTEKAALAALLTSGEAVIWLPRDICLWRYAAHGILEGVAHCQPLLEHLAAHNGNDFDPVLLSALPAFCLAAHPNPMPWLRLFRAVPARVTVGTDGNLATFVMDAPNPNLFAVIAIDGTACGKRLTRTLRGDVAV